jgi:demethylmenaquinone methyltransferase/2-methoxy-6-polyprenyl-1,4-benzoquinol methylase
MRPAEVRPRNVTEISRQPDRIAGMFDAIAARYDLLNHLLSAGIDRYWRRRAIAALRLAGGERVLDVCTGTGDLAIAARAARPAAGRVVGVDFAGEMLKIAHAKVARAGLASTIQLVRGDATRIPAADRSVRGVTVAFGIRNVERPQVACDEMYRTLAPGGRIAILEFAIPTAPVIRQLYLWYFRRVLPAIGRAVSRHDAAYGYLPASVSTFASPDQFVTILRKSGFVDVAAIPLTFGIVYLYSARRA